MGFYEEKITLPSSLTQNASRFSLDIGRTLIKLTYIDNKSQKNHAEVRMVSFLRGQLDVAIQHIQDNCDIPDFIKPAPEITLCGTVDQNIIQKINQELHIKARYMQNEKCFVKGFLILRKFLTLNQLLYPTPAAVKVKMEQWQAAMQEMMNKIIKHKFDLGQESFGNESESSFDVLPQQVVPSVMFILGASGAVIQINEDGSYKHLDITGRCGSTFIGLGKLLIGTKSFDELTSLAAEGDHREVDIMGADVKSGVEDDLYGIVSDDFMLYCFGKATYKTKENLKRKDIARAWLNALTQDLSHLAFTNCTNNRLPNIFVCGSFPCSHEVVREELLSQFAYRSIRVSGITNQTRPGVHVVRFGGYLGALGAMFAGGEP